MTLPATTMETSL